MTIDVENGTSSGAEDLAPLPPAQVALRDSFFEKDSNRDCKDLTWSNINLTLVSELIWLTNPCHHIPNSDAVFAVTEIGPWRSQETYSGWCLGCG
jgi:hypothetical protein